MIESLFVFFLPSLLDPQRIREESSKVSFQDLRNAYVHCEYVMDSEYFFQDRLLGSLQINIIFMQFILPI